MQSVHYVSLAIEVLFDHIEESAISPLELAPH